MLVLKDQHLISNIELHIYCGNIDISILIRYIIEFNKYIIEFNISSLFLRTKIVFQLHDDVLYRRYDVHGFLDNPICSSYETIPLTGLSWQQRDYEANLLLSNIYVYNETIRFIFLLKSFSRFMQLAL